MSPLVVRDDNSIAIPPEIGKRLGITPGSRIYVYQLGETLSLRLKPSELLEACEEFEAVMEEEGVTLDDLLTGLEDERAAAAQERRKGQTSGEAV